MIDRARYRVVVAGFALLLPSLSLAVTGDGNRKSF